MTRLPTFPPQPGPDAREVLCAIARTAMGHVDRILAGEQRLSPSVRPTSSSTAQFVREDAITAFLAVELCTDFSAAVRMSLFTGAQEERNGADWYWRIEHGGKALHALVQAKRVQRLRHNAADSQCRVNVDAEQLDLLMGAAADSRIEGLQTWLLTYGRSDSTPPCGCDPVACSFHKHGGDCGPSPSSASIWVAQAREVRAIGNPLLPQLVGRSIRLDCLLPCLSNSWEGPVSKGFDVTSGAPSFDECSDMLARITPIAGAINITA